MLIFDVVVVIPGLALTVPDLYETHAAFEQTAGDEELAGLSGVAVHFLNVFGFFGDVEGVAGFHLHVVGEFEGVDARVEFLILGSGGKMFFVELLQQVDLFSLIVAGCVFAFDELDQFFEFGVLRVDVGALVYAGQETGLPVLTFLNGISAGTHGYEAGQTLVFRAESVGDPGTEAGADESRLAGVHEHEGGFVIGDVGVHGANDAHIVDVFGGFGEEFADRSAAFAVLFEFEGGSIGTAGGTFGAEIFGGKFFTVVLVEHWFGIKRVDVGESAVEENVDDPFGFAGEVRLLGGHGIDV